MSEQMITPFGAELVVLDDDPSVTARGIDGQSALLSRPRRWVCARVGGFGDRLIGCAEQRHTEENRQNLA